MVEYPAAFDVVQTGATVWSLKAHNRRILLLNLLRHQPVSRVRLARLCGLSTTTVTNIVGELIAHGVVIQQGTDRLAARTGAGRPPVALHLVDDSRMVVGIHIDVRQARLALCNIRAVPLAASVVSLAPQEAAVENLTRIAAAARELIGAVPNDGLLGVGVGASGLTNVATGVNVMAPSLGWRNVAVRDILSRELGVAVTVDNNVRCMALAEGIYGAGRTARVMAYVHAGVSVGAGLMVNGELYRGANSGAGEIGHWTILPRGGKRCWCGNNGCLETLIAEPALIDRARQVDPYVADQGGAGLQAVFAAARRGHAGLRAMLGEQANYLGIALANLVNIMNPHVIVLGGLLQQGFDLLHGEVEATMRRHAFGGLGNRVVLQPATFGDQAGEIGAAALALDQFFFRQPATVATQSSSGATDGATE